MSARSADAPLGAVQALLAFVWWGLFPLYFRLVTGIPPLETLAHRVVWCLLFLGIVLSWRRGWGWLPGVFRQPKLLAAYAASALLIAANWLTYIWAVGAHHVVDASLGYFVNPLLNVLLGCWLLGERPRPVQWASVGIAAFGVVWLTVHSGTLPWIALVLAATFAGYGLLRKVGSLGPLEGLMLETIVLGPPALVAVALFAVSGHGAFSFSTDGWRADLWLIGFGPLTAVPLLLFAAAARRLTFSTLGLMQYVGPTIQLLVGVWAFGELLAGPKLVGFACIWLALVVYSAEGWRFSRQRPAAAAA